MEDAYLYFKFGQEAENVLKTTKEDSKKRNIRKVASQNYWYAAISAIEHVLTKKANVNLFEIANHQKRLRLLTDNYAVFSNVEVVDQYRHIYKDKIRTITAYKGLNGKRFQYLKHFAMLCIKELEIIKNES